MTLHMDITKILIIFVAAEDGETLYSEKKQDLECDNENVTAKFMLNRRKKRKP